MLTKVNSGLGTGADLADHVHNNHTLPHTSHGYNHNHHTTVILTDTYTDRLHRSVTYMARPRGKETLAVCLTVLHSSGSVHGFRVVPKPIPEVALHPKNYIYKHKKGKIMTVVTITEQPKSVV